MISRQRLGSGIQLGLDRNEDQVLVSSLQEWGRGGRAGVVFRGGARPGSGARGVGVRVGVGVFAGLALLMSFSPVDVWWVAPVGVAGVAVAVCGCRVWVGALTGFVCGLAFFVPLLSWSSMHTGRMPWLLLASSQAVFFGFAGAVSAWCSPVVVRWPVAFIPTTGVIWVFQEALRSRIPFGGFPWGRLAFSQGDSPVLRWAGVGGAPMVTWMVAVVGGVIAAVCWVGCIRWNGWVGLARVGGMAVGVGGLVGGGAVMPAVTPDGAPVTVAIVQGNVPRLGLDFNAQRRAVLANHVRKTVELADGVDAGVIPRPDFVVWPENSSDIDPLRDEEAAQMIDEAAVRVGVPIVVGAVLRADDGRGLNAGVVWQPGRGVEQRYIKRHPVPFAEYIPMRRLARFFSKKVDLVPIDFAPGDRPGVMTVGSARIGDVICFEVAYDSLVRDVVTAGGGLLVVQTNNATFNVAEARQQLAMVRLRAMEHRRPALMASTVGISAFVDVDGRIQQSSPFFTDAILVDQMRTGHQVSVATRVGCWLEWVFVAGAVVVCGVAGWLRRRPGHGIADG